MVKVRIKTDIDQLQVKLKNFGKGIEVELDQFVEDQAKQLLNNIIERNPVDTGRSRASWVESQEQLGGAAPPGWQGSHPEEAAIKEGRKLSMLKREKNKISFTSAVGYIQNLEYGTRNMNAFRMVRNSIRWVIARMRRRRR